MVAAFEIREILDDDLAEVAALLCEGFPRRTREYWRTGLQTLGIRERPPDTTKYGYVLVAENALRGVVLTIASVHTNGSERRVFINISSWYVQRRFRGSPAKELYRHACCREGTTYTNLSAAEHTIKTITSLGFEQWTAGQMLALGSKWRQPFRKENRILPLCKLGSVEIDSTEAELTADHENLGCLTFYLETASRLCPFVFARKRIKGFIPCAQLIYCRELTDLIEHGWTIWRWLAMRGFFLMLIDTSDPIVGLIGFYFDGKGGKYFKGPRPATAIDHTYSELVLLGV